MDKFQNLSKISTNSQINLIVASGLNDLSIKEEPPVVHYSHAVSPGSPQEQENNPFADKSNDSFARNLPRIRSPMFQHEKKRKISSR